MSGSIKGIGLNFERDEILTGEGIQHYTTGTYSFTGAIDGTRYLKVDIINLARKLDGTVQGQFIQAREISSTLNAGKFYGCNAQNWNFINPLLLVHNQQFANNGMQADVSDLNR